jgi:hypothetical protein
MSDMNRFRADLTAAGIRYVNDKGRIRGLSLAPKDVRDRIGKVGRRDASCDGVDASQRSEIDHADLHGRRMLPIWDAVGALPMFSDTQIDTQKLVADGQTVSESVRTEGNNSSSLAVPGKALNASVTGSVYESPEVGESEPARIALERVWLSQL